MAVFIFVVVMPQDVATHTAHAVLSSAAFADFQEEVVRRQSMGDDMGAVRLWTSAVEIRHKPWGWLPMVRPQGLPPLRWAPCMDATCARCADQRGGFQFPWLGDWTRRRVLVAHAITPFEAWEALAASDAKLDIMLVAAYGSGLTAEDIAPTGMEVVLERSGYERGHRRCNSSGGSMDLLAVWEPEMVGPQTELPNTSGCLDQSKSQSPTNFGRMDGRLLGVEWTFASGVLLVWRYGVRVVQHLWPESMQSLSWQGKGGPLLRKDSRRSLILAGSQAMMWCC